MERLTERDEFGNADIIGVDSADLQLDLDFDDFNRVTEALNRLAAYEDTGLEPEEVKEITSWSYGPFHKKMGDWLKAEREGRLVVLPCKDSPVWIVEEATHDCDTVPDKDCMSRPDCEGCPALKSYVRRLDEFYYTRAEAEKAMVSG